MGLHYYYVISSHPCKSMIIREYCLYKILINTLMSYNAIQLTTCFGDILTISTILNHKASHYPQKFDITLALNSSSSMFNTLGSLDYFYLIDISIIIQTSLTLLHDNVLVLIFLHTTEGLYLILFYIFCSSSSSSHSSSFCTCSYL